MVVGGLLVFGLLGLFHWSSSAMRAPWMLAFRASYLFVATWLLMRASGGVLSFFLLWYFIFVFVYSVALAARRAKWIPLFASAAYGLLFFLAAQPNQSEAGTASIVIAFCFSGWMATGLVSVMRDLLVQKEEKVQELAREQNKLRTIIDTVPDYIYVKDTQGRFVMNNRTHGIVLGAQTQEELIGKTDFDYFPKVDANRYRADEQEIFRSQQPLVDHEEMAMNAVGEQRIHLTSKIPLRDEMGRIAGLVGISRDITEQKATERELRQKSAELDAIWQALPDALIFADTDRSIRLVNPGFTETFGYTSEEVYGQKTTLLYASQEAYEEQGRQRYNLRAQEILLPYEVVYRRKNGTLFTSETVGTIAKDSQGESIGFVGVIRDITQRKEAEVALRNSEARHRALVEAMPDAMVRLSRDGVYVDVKEAADYKAIISFKDRIGQRISDVIGPVLGQEFLMHGTRALETGELQIFEFEARQGDAARVREARVMPLTGDDESIFILRDITERKRAQALLEERVEERTRKLSALLDISHNLTSTLDLEPLLHLILEQMEKILPYESGTVFRLEENVLVPIAHHGSRPELRPPDSTRFDLTRMANLHTIIEEQRPVWVHDAQKLDEAPAIQPETQALPARFHLIQSRLGIPLMAKGRVIGILGLAHTTPGVYGEEHAALAQAIGHQVGTVIENAQLHADTRRRLAEIESLQRVTSVLLQSRTLAEMADIICTEACKLIGASDAAIFFLQEGTWLEKIYAIESDTMGPDRLPVDDSFAGLAVHQMRPMFTNDGASEATVLRPPAVLQSLFVHPLMVEGTVIGTLHITNKPGGFSDDDIPLLSVLADQAAIAIEKARLHEQAEENAVLAERHRLARDLHDTVTQSIYSVILFADASRLALEAEKAAVAADNLREARQLAGTALADMRLLLYELHPPELADEGLVSALHNRLEAVESRAGLQVAIDLSGELDLPLALEGELYKIAQEALNNVVKHANAKTVTIQLDCRDGQVCMAIQDDGVGFDPKQPQAAAGMGLRNIGERVQQINGELSIQSSPGEGTLVQVTVKSSQ